MTQIALALLAAGCLTAIVPHPVFLFGSAVALGLGYGLVSPPVSQLLARFTPPARRNLVFSLKQTGVPLSGILAAVITPSVAVISAGSGRWRALLPWRACSRRITWARGRRWLLPDDSAAVRAKRSCWYNGRRLDMRILTAIFLLLVCAAAGAEMTCEQYGEIAQQTVRLRDQGASLSRLLADIERGEMKQRLTAHELGVVKDVMRASFNGMLSPGEAVEACRNGYTLVPSL